MVGLSAMKVRQVDTDRLQIPLMVIFMLLTLALVLSVIDGSNDTVTGSITVGSNWSTTHALD